MWANIFFTNHKRVWQDIQNVPWNVKNLSAFFFIVDFMFHMNKSHSTFYCVCDGLILPCVF